MLFHEQEVSQGGQRDVHRQELDPAIDGREDQKFPHVGFHRTQFVKRDGVQQDPIELVSADFRMIQVLGSNFEQVVLVDRRASMVIIGSM